MDRKRRRELMWIREYIYEKHEGAWSPEFRPYIYLGLIETTVDGQIRAPLANI